MKEKYLILYNVGTLICIVIPVKSDYRLVYDWPIGDYLTNVSLLLIGKLSTWIKFSKTGINTVMMIKEKLTTLELHYQGVF